MSKLSAIEKLMPLRTALAKFSGGGRAFAAMLELLAEHNLMPVFCLDEFEKLLDCKDELKKDFYDGLHSLINSNRMMLIIATRKPVESIATEKQLQSAFFNFGHLCTLGDFPDEEAEELLLLPSPLAPALDEDERRLARKWGGSTPHRLQLAAFYLFEARRLGKDTAWAKEQFKKQRDQTKQRGILNSPLGIVLHDCRSQLGWMAEDSEKCRKVLLNVALPLFVAVVLAFMLLTGKVQLSTVLEGMLKKIGLL